MPDSLTPGLAAPAVLGDEEAHALVASYPRPGPVAVAKDIGRIDPHLRRYIELSPFCCVATADAEGRQDVTPRGDPPGSFKVFGEHTIAIPDRPGNNRLDTLKNLLVNPQIGLIFLLPGMIAVALYKQGAPGFDSIGANPQGAFPVLVSNMLPEGLRGLVLAGMLSALMSALASLFNSTATLFTVDFYKRLRPTSSETHLVNVGRVATAGVIVLGMLWIPLLQGISKYGLYGYLQLVQSLLAPSIAAAFMAGIFSRSVSVGRRVRASR